MDKQPLNTGEQKDMTEFFTDLISKLEEMNPELKSLVKHLFGGVITNNVVSLDCDHVSQTVSVGIVIILASCLSQKQACIKLSISPPKGFGDGEENQKLEKKKKFF